jgi:uncharacterized damage-inducible protein DinB
MAETFDARRETMETVRRQCEICGEETEQAADLVAGLAAAPAMIAEAVRSAAGGGAGWSPDEVATHLADVEAVFAWRLRQTLAEDEPELQPFDQDRWAAALSYGKRDVALALAVYAAARAANVELLRTLDDAGWERRYRQPEYGVMSLRKLAQHKSDHDLAHLRQIEGR